MWDGAIPAYSAAVDYVRLSKKVAHALRHDPEAYGIALDPQGWVGTAELVRALRRQSHHYDRLEEADLAEMVRRADKPRFELAGGRIRARYGHSLAQKIAMEPCEPPASLYHGTTPDAAEKILREGLAPMDRQYVHLSVDRASAVEVGRRRAPEPTVLVVAAGAAWRDGLKFYRGHDRIWLADSVPATYLAREPAPGGPST